MTGKAKEACNECKRRPPNTRLSPKDGAEVDPGKLLGQRMMMEVTISDGFGATGQGIRCEVIEMYKMRHSRSIQFTLRDVSFLTVFMFLDPVHV